MATTQAQHQYKPYRKNVKLLIGLKDIYEYDLVLPDCPPLETITNYGLPPHQQKFKRVEMPSSIKKLNLLTREQAVENAAKDPEISAFIAKMWYHFKYGDFQFINGEPFHISPTYWFYLNFWKLDDGLPHFRYDLTYYCTDLWQFAWWDYMVVPNPFCYGMINGTRRKEGKSYKAMCLAYKIIISGRKRNGALQSKTAEDARDCFKVKMVEPVLEMPFFFKPFQANPSIPKAAYEFEPRSAKGKQDENEIVDPEEFLFSSFRHYNSKETACDGPKWYIHVSDEDGKLTEADCWERHKVIKPALRANEIVVGKEISTTTVEEMVKGGGEKFCYKWLMSNRDPNRKPAELTVNKFGETVSGLWPWFSPTRATMVFNEFGCSIIELPTKAEQKWLKEVKKDPYWYMGGRDRIKARIDECKSQRDKYSEMRKYPEEVRDMFISTTDFCYFDRAILEERLKYFAFEYERTELADKMAFINFHWENNVFGGKVGYTHAATKEDAIFWLSYIPRKELQNRFTINPDTDKQQPANWDRFSSGGDPFKFDTDQVVNKADMSFAAMTIWAEYDPQVDTDNMPPEFHVTGDMCGEACFREDMTLDEMNEQYLMAAKFFGMKFYCESNVGGAYEYFKRHDCEHYIEYNKKLAKTESGLYLKESTIAGSYTDAAAIQAMFRLLQKYVKERGLRCKFYRTLRQIYELTPENVGKKDLAVSLGKCLRVVMDFNPMRAQKQEDTEDIGDIMRGLGYTGIPNNFNSQGIDRRN